MKEFSFRIQAAENGWLITMKDIFGERAEGYVEHTPQEIGARVAAFLTDNLPAAAKPQAKKAKP